MPVLILYLFKLSLSLAVVFLFYHFVLRRLTFYNWNRFYLVAYTALSFFIPFINITPVLERNEMMNSPAVQFIPSVNAFTNTNDVVTVQASSVELSSWDWLTLFFAAGILVLVGRMLIQLFSFRKIVKKSILISSDSVKLYQVDQSIIPFSFGNSIFINKQQHGEQELQEIIRHEFVHIRQKHTVDIIWSELLCILNWYNPFVWLIRKAIRQNLEFIADDKVLQSGIDKKHYQYLLLKVTGNNYFSIASQFNFSSLKKRIAMMNKMKSAGVHLLKFLFLMPLLTVLILSFRGEKMKKQNLSDVYTVAGIVYDWDTEQPLANVNVADDSKIINVQTDKNGFYSFKLNTKENQGRHFTVSVFKPGYKQSQSGFTVGNSDVKYEIGFSGIVNSDSKGLGFYHSDLSRIDKKGTEIIIPDYEFLKENFKKVLEQDRLTKKVDMLVENSEKPIWVIDNIPFAIGAGAKAWFSKDEIGQSPEFRVWVDGKIMTMEEANRIVKRSMVKSVGASPKASALEEYKVNYNLLILGLYTDEAPGKRDTIPGNQIKPSASEKDFLKRHPEINSIRWVAKESTSNLSGNANPVIAGDVFIIIQCATKKPDVYNLSNSDDLKRFKNNYGEAPPEAPAEIPIVDSIEGNRTISNAVAGTSGQNFFKYDTQPIVILDGVEQPENTDPSFLIEPAEIAEMRVLKDKDAIAKYGYRAKNGVIALTSKTYAARPVEEIVSTTVKTGVNETPSIAVTSDVLVIEKPTEVTASGSATKELPGKPAQANSNGFGTLEPSKSQIATTSISPLKSTSVTAGKPAQTSMEPKSPVSVTVNQTATESVSTIKEISTGKNIIAVIKSKTTAEELGKIQRELKTKGYNFRATRTDFKNGKLILISGSIAKNNMNGGQVFKASDFTQLIISLDPDEDGNLFNFLVESGNLSVLDAN